MEHTNLSSVDRGQGALSLTVARNLRRLRSRRGFSSEQLARLAELDLPTLDRMENGKCEPTLEAAWRLADALDVPFAALIADHAPGGTIVTRNERAKVFVSADLGLASRALFPFDEEARVEFYELRFVPGHYEESRAHAPGTIEMLHVAEGTIEITVGREPPHLVNTGDTIQFAADLPHSYRNIGEIPATAYLVMNYQ